MTGNKETEEGCITRLLQELEWSPLAHRMKIHRLTVLHMSIQGEIAIEMPTYVQKFKTKSVTPAVCHHEIKFIHSAHQLTLINSFLPRTIVDRNSLLLYVATSGSVSAFKNAVNNSD